jgi:hypothetical protein
VAVIVVARGVVSAVDEEVIVEHLEVEEAVEAVLGVSLHHAAAEEFIISCSF